jgi:tmRNA-binding protein
LAIEGKFMLRAFIAALMLVGSCGSAFSFGRTQLLEEMRIVDEEIASADATLSEYDKGAIAMFAKTRKEMLLLSKAAIRARLLAADDPERATVVISTFAPNEEMAVSAAADFVLAKKRVADAQAEADEAGGMIKMLALVRVETERMAVSRLFMAYVSARYGVAYPALKDESVAGTKVPSVLAEPTADLSDADAADPVPAAPGWADPNHPEIDYTQTHFVSMNSAGGEMTGSWSVITSRAGTCQRV